MPINALIGILCLNILFKDRYINFLDKNLEKMNDILLPDLIEAMKLTFKKPLTAEIMRILNRQLGIPADILLS